MTAGRLGGRLAGAVLLVLVALVVVWRALLLLPDAPAQLRRVTHLARPEPRPTATLTAGESIPLAVPVAGVARATIRDSWGDPRENGLRAHHGTDIMAAGGTPVLAAAPGVVEKLWQSAQGGTTIYVRSPRRLWTYYYAHLSGYAPGLHEGQAVRTGDPIGFVGDTGDAGPGNFHLHFGLTRTTPDQRWYQGTDVDPFPYLAGPSLAGKPPAR